jgi:hypothetical protein
VRRSHAHWIPGRDRATKEFVILPDAFEHGTLQRASWREVKYRLAEIRALDSSCALRLQAICFDGETPRPLPECVPVPRGTSRVALWRLIHRVVVRAYRETPCGEPIGVLVQREPLERRRLALYHRDRALRRATHGKELP